MGLTRALIAVLGALTVMIVAVFTLGTVMDLFMYNFLDIAGDISPEFSGVLNITLNYIHLFYFLPVPLSILAFVYIFKWMIHRHRYGYTSGEQEGGYYYYDEE